MESEQEQGSKDDNSGHIPDLDKNKQTIDDDGVATDFDNTLNQTTNITARTLLTKRTDNS